MKKLGLVLASFVLVGAGCMPGSGVERREKFVKPDIKDDFCGVVMNFQYCKCAFHNEYCDSVGLSRGASRAYVQDEYNKWLGERRSSFGTKCAAGGGALQGNTCRYCADGYRAESGKCVADDEETEEPAEDEAAEAYVPDGPLNSDCTLKQEEFDAEWRKYSDIDDRIEFQSRSWEAQQAVTSYDKMIDLMVLSFEIERDLEIERAMQAELTAYKSALVQNMKTNLLKSFWRLAWVTYSTIDSSRGVGSSYSTLLTEGLSVETVGAGLKVIQASIPSQSALAIDTGSLSGKAKSVGANTALEAIDSLGDPIKIATEFVKSSAMATLPSADISPEEVEILRTQHLKNGAIDESLRQSRETIEAMEGMLTLNERDIEQYQAEIEGWEAKEKARVAAVLIESCKKLSGQE